MTAAAALDNGDFWLSDCFLSAEIPAVMSAAVGGVWRSGMESPYESRNVSLLDLYNSPAGLKVSGGSPQSTLGGIGSWSGRSSDGSNHNSPPATPYESREDTLGLIYAAAGQVAKLQMSGEEWRAVAKPNPPQNQNAGVYSELKMKLNYLAALRQANEAALIREHQLQRIRSGVQENPRRGASSEPLNQSAWPPLQQTRVPLKPDFSAFPLKRKESAGTGVFIPRRYDASPPVVPPRKRTVAPCAVVPAKVAQALNTSVETMSACSQSNCNPIPTDASICLQSYDTLMARRRVLLDQQQRTLAKNDDIASRSLEACLPQEWSY